MNGLPKGFTRMVGVRMTIHRMQIQVLCLELREETTDSWSMAHPRYYPKEAPCRLEAVLAIHHHAFHSELLPEVATLGDYGGFCSEYPLISTDFEAGHPHRGRFEASN